MTRVALRGLAGRKLRAALTALAIVLGVSLMSGTFVLTDSIQQAFNSVFTSSYRNTDAVVSGRKLVDWSVSGQATVPASVLTKIKGLTGVAAASGQIVDLNSDADQAKLIDKTGKAITGGAPTFGFGFDPSLPRFNPFQLAQGRWAKGPAEVVIDAATAANHGFALGDSIGVAADGPVRRFRIVGTARMGGVDSFGGATFALFDLPTAQAVLHKNGFDTISIAAKPGVTTGELMREVRAALPPTAQVRPAAEQAKADSHDIGQFVSFIRWFLLGFGGVALVVGAFVIFNTLSITVAQRTRELATLRTLGASRRQVLRSVVLEALVLGTGSSLAGLGLGIGLARGLSALFKALSLDLPQSGTVLAVRTVVVSLVVGTLITLIAGLWPAIRATRVPPIAAVREGAVAHRPSSTYLPYVGGAVTALAGAALAYGMFKSGLSTTGRVLSLGAGLLGLFVGVAMLSSRLVRPLVALVGLPARRIGGVAGRLAQENATRNPGRTAATAAALMIGLALVTFVAVLGQGLRASSANAVRGQLHVTDVVTSQNGWGTLPTGAGKAIASAPGVQVASSIRYDRAKVDGSNVDVNGVDPATIAAVYRFDWAQGSDTTLASLGSDEAIVRRSFAKGHHLVVGSPLEVKTPAGKVVRVRVAGIFEPPRFDPLLGSVLLSQRTFDAAFPSPGDLLTLVLSKPGTSLGQTLAAYPDAKVQTVDGFVKSRVSDLDSILNLLYVLLALSVIVSLFGMVNTLVLAVFERTRELGTLRAIGLTRRQTRRMIRHESVITALIGAALGMPLGVLLAALVTRSLSDYGIAFAVPGGPLAAFVAVAVIAGVNAAHLPARRASKLNVLAALQYE